MFLNVNNLIKLLIKKYQIEKVIHRLIINLILHIIKFFCFIYFFIRKTIYKKMLKYIDFFNIS